MITVAPNQMAWLKSIVEHGPTAYCLDGVTTSLVRKGLAVKQSDGKLAASDLGRQVINAHNGEQSTLIRA